MRYFIWLVAVTALLGVVSAGQVSTRDCMKPCPQGQPHGDVYLVPHRNCSHYCSCNYGIPYAMECVAGLHFSPEHRVCTWPYEAKCKTARQMDKSSTFLRSMSLSTGHCFGACPGSDPPGLSVNLEHEDCDKYCKCEGGIPYLHQCPANFHFSLALGICTYPSEAHCSRSPQPPVGWCPCPTSPPVTSGPVQPPVTSKPVPPPVTSKPVPPPVTSKPLPPPVPTKPTPQPPSKPTSPPVINAEGCIGVCQEINPFDVEQLPHKLCSKFCKCDNDGLPKVMSCNDGLYYNPVKRVCDYPNDAGCTGIQA